MKSFSIPPASEPFLQQGTNTIALSWYRFLSSALATLGSGQGAKDFTPLDASGAVDPIIFHAVSVQFSVFGGFVYVYGQVTFPTTSDTSFAAMTLPVTVPDQVYAEVPGIVMTTGGLAPMVIVPSRTGNHGVFLTSQGNSNITNATLSGIQLNFMLAYPSS